MRTPNVFLATMRTPNVLGGGLRNVLESDSEQAFATMRTPNVFTATMRTPNVLAGGLRNVLGCDKTSLCDYADFQCIHRDYGRLQCIPPDCGKSQCIVGTMPTCLHLCVGGLLWAPLVGTLKVKV